MFKIESTVEKGKNFSEVSLLDTGLDDKGVSD